MTDRHLPPAPPDDDLRAALRSLLTQGGGNGPAGEAHEAARRLEAARTGGGGPSSEALCADDLALLGDLGQAQVQVESGTAEGPSQAVLAAAREAFAREAAASELTHVVPARALSVPSSAWPATARADRPHVRLADSSVAPVGSSGAWSARLRALAAVLVVGLGVAWFLGTREAEAQPVLALAGLDRYATGGEARVESGGHLEARPGTSFVAGKDEVLALRLADGGRLVLRSGERLEVAAAQGPAQDHGAALLRLQGGEVLLARDADAAGPVPLLISLPGGEPLGVLVLHVGAAHVAQPPGREATPAVALGAGARAQFVVDTGAQTTPNDPRGTIELRGPVQVLLTATGAVVEGEPARHAFRDLETFGGPRLERRAEPFVTARVWRVVSGRGERAGDALTLRGAAVLGWTPDVTAGRARTLRLLLRGPVGLTVSLPDLGTEAVLRRADSDPGLATLDVPLPEGWTSALPAHGELRLVLAWPAELPGLPKASAAPARFEGAFLGLGGPGTGA